MRGWYPGYGTGTSRGAVTGPIHLKGLPLGGYRKDYRATLSQHQTLQNALAWGSISGLAADGRDRLGRLWIEAAGQPATR
jgi:hypothetical protein